MSNHRNKDLLNCKCGAQAILFCVNGEIHKVWCQKDEAVIEWNKQQLPTWTIDFKGTFLIHAKSEAQANKIFQTSIHQNYMRPMEYEAELQLLNSMHVLLKEGEEANPTDEMYEPLNKTWNKNKDLVNPIGRYEERFGPMRRKLKLPTIKIT